MVRRGCCQEDSKVTDVRGGSQRGVVNRECEIVGRFGERFGDNDGIIISEIFVFIMLCKESFHIGAYRTTCVYMLKPIYL